MHNRYTGDLLTLILVAPINVGVLLLQTVWYNVDIGVETNYLQGEYIVPITVNTTTIQGGQYREDIGTTTTNEVIYKLNPKRGYIFEMIVTTGVPLGAIKTSANQATPVAFTNFVIQSSAVAANITFEVSGGQNWIGFDITTGTWDVRVQEFPLI